MWTDELLMQATKRVSDIRKAFSTSSVAPTKAVIEKIILALSDDLDTPTALAALDQWAADTLSGSSGGEAQELSAALDALLGLEL
jgi:L-cysteine:1D-myo-inositol 2-amino-2-deoxy-alpha-D-glucopyranoside ligase